MEDFINSEKFYQMAKEYNQKYGTISTLSTFDFDKTLFIKILENIYQFIFLIKKGFGKNLKFKQFFLNSINFEKLLEDIEKKYDINVNKNFSLKDNFVSNKNCIKLILETIKMFFQVKNIDKNQDVSNLLDGFFDYVLAFYSAF